MATEKRLITSRAYGNEFPMVIAMLADGRLHAEPLITQRLPLTDALQKGLTQYEVHAATNVRTVIEIS
jgi:threonine dehydrogenase-like Zn-dependent dehydrogenase